MKDRIIDEKAVHFQILPTGGNVGDRSLPRKPFAFYVPASLPAANRRRWTGV